MGQSSRPSSLCLNTNINSLPSLSKTWFVCSFIYSIHSLLSFFFFFLTVSLLCSGPSLVAGHRLLIAVASPAAEVGSRVRGLSSCGCTGLVAPWHVGGIFPDQWSNLCPLHWQADSYSLDHQGGPQIVCICLKRQRSKRNSFFILNIDIPQHLSST